MSYTVTVDQTILSYPYLIYSHSLADWLVNSQSGLHDCPDLTCVTSRQADLYNTAQDDMKPLVMKQLEVKIKYLFTNEVMVDVNSYLLLQRVHFLNLLWALTALWRMYRS